LITEIGLENFKSFSAQYLRLAPLTLLAGMNGMGKSTLLQALLLLRQSWQQKMLPDALGLNGELIAIGTGKDARYESADSDEILFSLTHSTGAQMTWRFTARTSEDWLRGAGFEGQIRDNEEPLFIQGHFHYLNAERVGPRVSYPVSDYRVRRLGEIGVHGEFAAHFLEVFGTNLVSEQMRHPSTVSTGQATLPGTQPFTLFDQVEAWLGEISPGTRLYRHLLQGVDQVQLGWGSDVAGFKSSEYRSTNVGFGLSYILPVLVALLSASPNHLILIENPEAHLHPRGQRLIGDLIARCASSGTQVIIETHSDHVLNGIRLAVVEGQIASDDVQIHYVERGASGDAPYSVVHSPILYPDGRLSDWPEGFFDEWEKSLRLLLKPREGGQGGGT